MVGFYTGSIGSEGVADQGLDAVPSSASSVLGAVAGEALTNNPTPRLFRSMVGVDAGAQQHWQNYQDPAGRNAGSDVDAMAAEGGDAPAILDPEDANKRFGIKGQLSFDKPVAESIASTLHDHKQDEIARQDAINRRTPGLMTGFVARGATSLAMGLLDPINLAAGLVPGFGEARIGGAFGWDIASSTGQRVAARTLSGASGGAAGMAVLEPLNYALDRQEHNDWSMGDALRNIAYGALIGGVLHPLIGALGDRGRPEGAGEARPAVEPGRPAAEAPAAEPVRPATEPAPAAEAPANTVAETMSRTSAETQAMAMRGAVAHVADGRAVDVAPAVGAVEGVPATLADIEHMSRMEDIAANPGIADLLDQIKRGGKLQPKNEQSLVSWLVANGGISDPNGELTALVGTRSRPGLINRAGPEADVAGVNAREAGYFPEHPSLANKPDTMHTGALYDAIAEELNYGNKRFAGTEDVATRQVAKLADELDRVLSEHGLSVDSPKEEILAALRQADEDWRDHTAQRASDAQANVATLRDNAAAPAEHPLDREATRANAAAVERAPKVEGRLSEDFAEAQRQADEMAQTIERELKAGGLTEGDLAELRTAEANATDAEGFARAMEAAAMCMRSI
jgi:hypothetical protein